MRKLSCLMAVSTLLGLAACEPITQAGDKDDHLKG
jgi:hypothetical protein